MVATCDRGADGESGCYIMERRSESWSRGGGGAGRKEEEEEEEEGLLT